MHHKVSVPARAARSHDKDAKVDYTRAKKSKSASVSANKLEVVGLAGTSTGTSLSSAWVAY